MPLRTVGRWMGKNISWDSASRTVFLSGTTEKSYPCADDDAYHKEGVKYVGVTGTATLDKGVKVHSGAKLCGTPVHPLIITKGETV